MLQDLIIATGNKGKLAEIRQIMSDLPLVIKSLADYFDPLPHIEENGATFVDNARIKAAWVYSRTNCMTLADDSGLMVDFLNGAPGVTSARYAGENASDEQNRRKLLAAMRDCPPSRRTARFSCVIAVQLAPEKILIGRGACEGVIGLHESGTQGFGYDSLFVPQGFTQTFAELNSTIKNTLSHRGRALTEIKRQLHESVRS